MSTPDPILDPILEPLVAGWLSGVHAQAAEARLKARRQLEATQRLKIALVKHMR